MQAGPTTEGKARGLWAGRPWPWRRERQRAALCLLAAAALAGPARAQATAGRPASEARVPNLLGGTGLLLLPSAFVQRPGQRSAVVGARGRLPAGGVVAGAAPRLEIGLAALVVARPLAADSTRLLLNAKANALAETLVRPAVSVGVIDTSGRLDRGPGWYVVASKSLIRYFVRGLTGQNVALKLHLGYGGGLYHDEVMGGAELFLGHGVSAMAESVSGRVNLGGRLQARGLTVTLGLLAWQHLGGAVSFTRGWR